MKRRNPSHPHRQTKAQAKLTAVRVEQFYGLVALLNTWEQQPDEVQIRNHAYIIGLRARVRQVRMYVLHRADPDADIISREVATRIVCRSPQPRLRATGRIG